MTRKKAGKKGKNEESCKACETRTLAGFEGLCPHHASRRASREMAAERVTKALVGRPETFAYTHVVTWKNPHRVHASFPAAKSEHGTLVDLRGYEGKFDRGWMGLLVRDGVPRDIVERGLDSKPPGFVLLPNPPTQEGA